MIVIMIDGSENKKKRNFFVKAAFELQSSHVFGKRINHLLSLNF